MRFNNQYPRLPGIFFYIDITMAQVSSRIPTICCKSVSRLSIVGKRTPRVGNSLTNFQQIRHMRIFRERTIRLMYWRSRSFDVVKFERRRSEFEDWNYRSEIFAFSRRLQENISEDTLREVFTHSSYVDNMREAQQEYNLPEANVKSNQELVQRGKQLLDDCIKPYLRYTFNRMPEDGIIDITSYLKSDEVLASIAKSLGCKEIILSSEYPPNDHLMADTIRAFIGGVERDLGKNRVQRFIVDIILTYLDDKSILDDIWIIPNPRETLNLILKNSKLPNYEPRIMFQTGIKTLEPCHIVGLYVNERYIGSNAGETLKIAEHCAALNALERLFDLTHSRAPYVYGEESSKIDYLAHNKEHNTMETWKVEC